MRASLSRIFGYDVRIITGVTIVKFPVEFAQHHGGAHPKHNDDWWLDLYVMLSRATRLEDLLLMRAPPASFLLQGPPASLRLQLDRFAARTTNCRQRAMKLVAELGFKEFLH